MQILLALHLHNDTNTFYTPSLSIALHVYTHVIVLTVTTLTVHKVSQD